MCIPPIVLFALPADNSTSIQGSFRIQTRLNISEKKILPAWHLLLSSPVSRTGSIFFERFSCVPPKPVPVPALIVRNVFSGKARKMHTQVSDINLGRI